MSVIRLSEFVDSQCCYTLSITALVKMVASEYCYLRLSVYYWPLRVKYLLLATQYQVSQSCSLPSVMWYRQLIKPPSPLARISRAFIEQRTEDYSTFV